MEAERSSEHDVNPKPIMDWESQEHWAEGVVWWTRLDGRFQIEVHRCGDAPMLTEQGVQIGSESYSGVLLIFDHQDDDKLLYSEHVGLSYGAPFGADVADETHWKEIVIDFVDNVLPDLG